MKADHLPTLRGVIVNARTVPQLRVWCPECNAYHLHGWPSRCADPDYAEHRAPHCFDRIGKPRSRFRPYGYMIAHR